MFHQSPSSNLNVLWFPLSFLSLANRRVLAVSKKKLVSIITARECRYGIKIEVKKPGFSAGIDVVVGGKAKRNRVSEI